MTIRFYRTSETPYGCFSNFSAHPLMLDGVRWPTSEHYFQAQKFADTLYVEDIRKEASPAIAARMGRSRTHPIRADWEQVKDDAMRRAVYAKFAQHANIRAVLFSTGDEEIIEDAPNDYYWGCGASGTGKNMLGIILMETRAALRTEDAQGVG